MSSDDTTTRLRPENFDLPDIPEGNPAEESTIPETEEELPLNRIPRREIKRSIDRFFFGNQDFLGRGTPYLEHVFYDFDLDCPHVILSLKFPIPAPTEATITAVQQELMELGEKLCPVIKTQVLALSANLN